MKRVLMVTITVLLLIGLAAVPACVPEPEEYTLTMAVSPEDSGTTTPTGTVSGEAGTVVAIEATANPGWEFVDWTAPAGVFADATAASTTFIMPSQDVTVTANFVAPLFTIIRDDYGVPHVFAHTREGLAFGAGYAMAQDRLWQADVMRRTASGRLAELLGEDFLPQDKELRALWYNQDELQEIYDEWDPGAEYAHLKPMIEAYVDGINLYIEEAFAAFFTGDWSLMPIEYVANRIVSYLEPFTVGDVVAVTVLMAWRFGGTGGNEAQFYEALLGLQAMHGEEVGGLIWNELFPLDDPGAPVTIPDQVYEAGVSSMAVLDYPGGVGVLSEEYEESRAGLDTQLESLGIPSRFGSNVVLVRPELSATGNALQLGGPQMGYSVPQIVYEIGLHGAGINAVGMAFPGAGPFILIGVSEHGAWTSTTGASDVVDIRVLALNPDNPTQYLFNGDWRDMEIRTETFHVQGAEQPITETFYRSHYGPVVRMDLDEGTAFTMHTPFYRDEIGAEQGWQVFQEATSIEAFEAAVELIQPSHNFFWTDTEGNIGFWHAGTYPIKPEGADPRLPLMGDGTQEWAGITGPGEMPTSINPEQGWLANWNNKPIAGWPFAESDFHWGEGHRVQVLLNTMAAMAPAENLTTDHLNQINQVGGYHHTEGMAFVSYVIDAAQAYLAGNGDPQVAEALSYLAAWATAEPLPVSYADFVSPKWPDDENPTYDHAGLTIFDAWYDRIVTGVFDGILPPDLVGRVKGSPSLLLRVFEGQTVYDYLGETDGDALIVEALQEAIAHLEAEYGEDMAEWLTDVRMQRYDEMGALPGGALHPRMNRGTYNHIAELSAPLPRGRSVIPPGQSGFMWLEIVDGRTPTPRPSEHSHDQVLLYASWTYKPMLLTLEDVEAVETWRREYFE